ncbi:hypothetical protein MCOR03_001277 [Pyricularia oryzae]|nr:hypothetical protein MCOR30_006775 [Pyricularia oryzae]KAI6411035.1 hypothetical protein MCOR20_004382 [Pyricularia oryzae]KAI6538858.1 hypothetical protein MCOR16_001557 [Pyricularia oryzae]KAI6566921.1 hypothetical protein MCOR03_001277 [Pyricularia oryzae]KAI6574800.1 hypothetical protein MCOR09_002058 [Pyricularia oryzae]
MGKSWLLNSALPAYSNISVDIGALLAKTACRLTVGLETINTCLFAHAKSSLLESPPKSWLRLQYLTLGRNICHIQQDPIPRRRRLHLIAGEQAASYDRLIYLYG